MPPPGEAARHVGPDAHRASRRALPPDRDRSPVAAAPNADKRAVFWPILTLERAANGDRSRSVWNSVVWATPALLSPLFFLLFTASPTRAQNISIEGGP